MGQMVYDPVRGMVYKPDWWEQIGGALQAVPGAVSNEVGRIGLSQQAINARAAMGAGAGDPIVPPPWASGASDVLPPLAPGIPGSTFAGPPAPASAFGPTDAGAAALPPVIGPPGGPGGPAPGTPGLLPALTPGGAIAGSSAQYPDETRRGLASPVAGVGGPGGGVAGLGGLGGGMGSLRDLTNEGALQLYEDTTGLALRQGFQDAGIDSFKNPYAQRAIQRYAPILGKLMDFFAIATGIDSSDTDAMATWVPQFIQQFMSGAINPGKLVQQAIATARGNPVLESYLVDMLGPDELLKLQGATSGYGGRVEAARQNVLSERIMRQRMAQQRRPGDEDVDRKAWLDIIQAGAR